MHRTTTLCTSNLRILALAIRFIVVAIGFHQAFSDDTPLREFSQPGKIRQLNSQVIAELDLGLERSLRIQKAIDATLRTRDYANAAEVFDQELRGKKIGDVHEWMLAAVAHSHLGNLDDAFAYLDEAIERGLELDPKTVEDDLIHYGISPKLTQDNRYMQLMERICELRDSWQADIDPARYGILEPHSNAMDVLHELSIKLTPEQFAKKLAEYGDFPTPSRRDVWVKYDYFGVDRKYPFFLYIPPEYDPSQASKLIVYLHGESAKQGRIHKSESRAFLNDSPFQEVARKHNMLLMCPIADNSVNWWEQSHMNVLMGELTMVKKRFNVDDDAVWLSGYSKGGTGAFGIAINAPTAFASFYPLNATPVPTRLGNLQYRPVYSTYSTRDTKFPIEQMEALWKYACEQNANWLFRELPGHDHSYHSYIEQELPSIVEHMLQNKRPPMAPRIAWETSLNVMSGCDWLRVERVTPGQNRAEWHDRPHSTTHSKVPSDASNRGARRLNEDVGKIRAQSNGNIFHVETSQIGEFSIRLSPQMVDFRLPIKVYVNGRLVRDENVAMDSDVMLNYFDREADRQRIWCNVLRVVVPKGA